MNSINKVWIACIQHFAQKAAIQYIKDNMSKSDYFDKVSFFEKMLWPTKRQTLQLELMQEFCELTYPDGVPVYVRNQIALGWWE